MTSERRGKWFELLWPWFAAIAAAACGLMFSQHIHLASEAKSRLLDKFVDVCAISVGFWATALALLLALEDRKTVDGLRKLGIYERIVDYFLDTVYSYFVLLLCCLVTIAFGHPPWLPHNLYVAGWTFILTFSASAMLRSFLLLGKLLKAK